MIPAATHLPNQPRTRKPTRVWHTLCCSRPTGHFSHQKKLAVRQLSLTTGAVLANHFHSALRWGHVCGLRVVMFAAMLPCHGTKRRKLNFQSAFLLRCQFLADPDGGLAVTLTLGMVYCLKTMRGEGAGYPVIGRSRCPLCQNVVRRSLAFGRKAAGQWPFLAYDCSTSSRRCLA